MTRVNKMIGAAVVAMALLTAFPAPMRAQGDQGAAALAALPELHRAALALRYFEEMDYRSIENMLGLTNGALRGILGRALASLRKQLRPALASMD